MVMFLYSCCQSLILFSLGTIQGSGGPVVVMLSPWSHCL
jgi:hypothetical protein